MNQKPALWLSIGLTVFILFFLSNVFRALAGGQNLLAQAGTAQPTDISPEIQTLIAERQQAFTQLEQANAQLLQAQQALAASQGSNAGAAGTSSSGAQITADQAAQIALQAALPGAHLSGSAGLVNFEGTVAYEVPFDLGNIYINATSGELLYNGTVNLQPAPINEEQAAQIAAVYLGRTDIYRIELTELSGLSVYRVKFINGDAVFVDQYGNILLVRLASTGTSSGSSSRSSSEHVGEHDD